MKLYYFPVISITLLTIMGSFTPLKAEEKTQNQSPVLAEFQTPTQEEIINACIQNQADRLPNPYIDVEPTHWAYKAVLSLYYCGAFRLELVALPENGGTHLDFYLLTGDNHQSVPDAKVTAQIELPNGEQQTLDLSYDPQGEHYKEM